MSNVSEISLMSILKLFFDMFVSFSEKGDNYYLPLNWECSGFGFINDNSKKEKKKKKMEGKINKINKSVEVVQL